MNLMVDKQFNLYQLQIQQKKMILKKIKKQVKVKKINYLILEMPYHELQLK
jgi:hypothetical protein